jgi:acyl carrier protein
MRQDISQIRTRLYSGSLLQLSPRWCWKGHVVTAVSALSSKGPEGRRVTQTRSDIEAEIRAILSGFFPGDDVAHLSSDTNLLDALDMDSLTIIDLALELERIHGIHIPDEDLPRLRTIGSVADLIDSQMGAATPHAT